LSVPVLPCPIIKYMLCTTTHTLNSLFLSPISLSHAVPNGFVKGLEWPGMVEFFLELKISAHYEQVYGILANALRWTRKAKVTKKLICKSP
jgi:hypothetical protein